MVVFIVVGIGAVIGTCGILIGVIADSIQHHSPFVIVGILIFSVGFLSPIVTIPLITKIWRPKCECGGRAKYVGCSMTSVDFDATHYECPKCGNVITEL